MVSKGRHPKNPVAGALAVLPRDAFDVIEVHRGHRWGQIVCRRCGATQGVWSTPKDSDDHARQIERFASKHQREGHE